MAEDDRVLVIGVGNEFRGDDGVGVVVARRLAALRPPGAEVVELSGEGTELMDRWTGRGRVIAVDAVRSGRTPGAIVRLDAHRDPIPSDFFHYSSHAFGLAEAAAMSRVLGSMPEEFVIYGVEGADFGAGQRLSPAVEAAAADLVARIARDHLGVQTAGAVT